jgi:hypothetical protein
VLSLLVALLAGGSNGAALGALPKTDSPVPSIADRIEQVRAQAASLPSALEETPSERRLAQWNNWYNAWSDWRNLWRNW